MRYSRGYRSQHNQNEWENTHPIVHVRENQKRIDSAWVHVRQNYELHIEPAPARYLSTFWEWHNKKQDRDENNTLTDSDI